MDKKMIGLILIGAALYYMFKKEAVAASDSTTSDLDIAVEDPAIVDYLLPTESNNVSLA